MRTEGNDTTKKLCVIGDPVLHSKSPLIQNAMISALGLDYVYLRRPVKGGQGAAWLEAAKAAGYAGFNATMPFKEELLPVLDEVEPFAAACGAVNTVCIREGKAYGYNTDGPGFLSALDGLGVDPAGKRVVLLGAGGAAKAVALALADAGAEVTVCNRTPARAQALCALAPAHLTPAGSEPETLAALAEKADLLVNCTSLGMEGTGADFADLSFVEALPAGAAVCDAIYFPPETALLKRARETGHPAMNGLGMLVGQAVLALEHFVGGPIDRKKARAAALAALAGEGQRMGLRLRDMVESDIEDYVRWFTTDTEWMDWDSPWESGDAGDPAAERESWTKYCAHVAALPQDAPRWKFEIEADGTHIGWVSAYDDMGPFTPPEPGALAVGIDIPEPACRGKGAGYAALRQFMDYYKGLGHQVLYTQTWSGNAPMLALAAKLGFREVFRAEGVRQVRGERYDAVTLRAEL